MTQHNSHLKRTGIQCPNCDCELDIIINKGAEKKFMEDINPEIDYHLEIAKEMAKDYALPKNNGGTSK